MLDVNVSDLSFSYYNKPILKDINITFEKGKITGILGANGSGKSTLLKNILHYLKPKEGTVFVNLKNVKDLTNKEIAKTFALVPQKSSLTTPLTVYEIVLMGRISKIENNLTGFTKKDKQITLNILEKLDLLHLKDNTILEISGGEMQRALLARALVQEPEILLLDESTANLDIKHALDITHVIAQLVKEGLTCITVLHDLNLAGMYCDNIVFLKNGYVKHIGTTKDLFNQKILKDVYGFDCIVVSNNGYPYVLPERR